jgi:hypothetical protein
MLTDGIENTAFEDPPGTFVRLQGETKYRPDLSGDVNTSQASWPGDVKRYAIGVRPHERDRRRTARDPRRRPQPRLPCRSGPHRAALSRTSSG